MTESISPVATAFAEGTEQAVGQLVELLTQASAVAACAGISIHFRRTGAIQLWSDPHGPLPGDHGPADIARRLHQLITAPN